MTIVDLLSGRIVEVPSDHGPFWKIPEFALTILGEENDYIVDVWPKDNPTTEDGTDHTIMERATAHDIVALISMIENDVLHAKEWLVRDADDGFLGDIENITDFEALWKTPVEPNFYILGCGDINRDHRQEVGITESEWQKMETHNADTFAKGIVGKGMTPSGSSPNGDAIEGYHATIKFVIDAWIKEGGFKSSLKSTGPTI